MNYRLGVVEREGLVARYLIVGVYSGQERCAGVWLNFPLGGLNLMVFYFFSFQWKRISRKSGMQLKNCLEEISFQNRNED